MTSEKGGLLAPIKEIGATVSLCDLEIIQASSSSNSHSPLLWHARTTGKTVLFQLIYTGLQLKLFRLLSHISFYPHNRGNFSVCKY